MLSSEFNHNGQIMFQVENENESCNMKLGKGHKDFQAKVKEAANTQSCVNKVLGPIQ